MNHRRAFWIFVFVVFATTVTDRLLFVLFPTYLIEKNFTATQIGLVFSAAAVVLLLLNPVVGRLSDRHGRKFVMSLSMLINSVCITAYPFLSRITEFAVVKSLQDTSFSIKAGLEDSLQADKFPKKLRPAYLISLGKILVFSRGFGSVVGVLVAVYLSVTLGFFTAAAFTFAALAVFALLYKEDRIKKGKKTKFNPLNYPRRFKFVALSAFVISFTFSLTYAPAFFILAERYLGISAGDIFALLLISHVITFVAIQAVERRVKSFGRKDIFSLSFVVLGFSTLAYAAAKDVFLLAIAMIFVSAAFQFWRISFKTIMMDSAERKRRGEQIGLIKTLHGVGDASGAAAGGLLIDLVFIQAPFVVGGILYLATAVFILKML